VIEKILTYKKQPARAVALTAVFAALYALFGFLAIPDVASFETIILFMVGVLFGPEITVPSCLIGEIIAKLIFPQKQVLFYISSFLAVVVASLVMSYGRRLASRFGDAFNILDKRSRLKGEAIAYILAVGSFYVIYAVYDVILLYAGIFSYALYIVYVIEFLIAFAVKATFIVICIPLVEAIRKYLNEVYLDIRLVPQEEATTSTE
jgi:hypothetical protein